MSNSARQRSDEFLRTADQFKLGHLATEASHPLTEHLSDVAREDIAAALRLLFKVDGDVVRKYQEVVSDGRLESIAAEVLKSLHQGGRIFFTGCGATGRLSILLDSMWRDFWQRQRAAGWKFYPSTEDWENRVFSVMAGGDFALIKSVEGFEDYAAFGRKQIGDLGVRAGDVVFAITEGGETSFVIGTAWEGVDIGAKVYFVYNNPDDILSHHVERSREIISSPRVETLNLTTGPMAISGSTRMQATTIQLCVMATVLEMVVRGLSDGLNPASTSSVKATAQAVRNEFLTGLESLHQSLGHDEVIEGLASLVNAETEAYRAGRKAHYSADHFAIDVLTDTTERSPTFCTPPFRKLGDRSASESVAFLRVPGRSTAQAWEWLLKRSPRCLEWSQSEIEGLVSDAQLERTMSVLGKITTPELLRFGIGREGIADRPVDSGDFCLTICSEPHDVLCKPERRPESASSRQASVSDATLLIGASGETSPNLTGPTVRVPVPPTDFLLDGLTRVAVKMVLNAISTCVMVRLGRVMGNTMIYVTPSNLKLIDRATRYTASLARLDYEDANRLLFEAIEYVEPRMLIGRECPPVVGLAVLRAQRQVEFAEAETILLRDQSL